VFVILESQERRPTVRNGVVFYHEDDYESDLEDFYEQQSGCFGFSDDDLCDTENSVFDSDGEL